MNTWRDSKLFVYGYLPVRAVLAGVGVIAALISTVCIFLMWFQPWQAKQCWRNLF